MIKPRTGAAETPRPRSLPRKVGKTNAGKGGKPLAVVAEGEGPSRSTIAGREKKAKVADPPPTNPEVIGEPCREDDDSPPPPRKGAIMPRISGTRSKRINHTELNWLKGDEHPPIHD